MTAGDWSRLKTWFGDAMDAEPAEVSRILAEAEQYSPELAQELRILLRENAAPKLLTNSLRRSLAAAETRSPADTVGPYRILRELGRGGTGIVYLAEREDDEFHRPVALKLLRNPAPDGKNDALLTRERRALAQLRHPNIAALTDWGTASDATPWLALEYVEGVPIDRYCASLDGPAILALFLQVCQAVQYAHQHLILHSDLKPANILVTPQGQVKLLDFGISRLLEDGVALQTVDTRFTPGYASPEQIQGRTITAASDVYALGLVLYELMTGSLPGVDPGQTITLEDLARRSAGGPLPRASTSPALDPERARFLQGDLDRVLLHALEHDAGLRYPSVGQFLADVENFRAGFPISILPPSLGYQARKLITRHRGTAAVAAAAVLALVALAGVATWQAYAARRQQLAAERRFHDLRNLAHSVIFDLHDSIRYLPGSTPARRTLVSTAMQYLDGLRQENIEDDSLLMEMAAGYFRMGYVQVGIGSQSLGDTPAGRRSYQAALEILEDQWRRHPGDRKAGALRFAVLYNLSMSAEDPAQGVAIAERYAAEADQWRRKDRAGAPFQAAALLHQAAGRARRASGDLDGALREFETAAGLFTELVELSVDRRIEQMVAAEVHKSQTYQDLSRTLALESAVYRDMQRPAESAEFHRRSMDALRTVAQLDHDPALLASIDADHDWKANRALDEGRLDEALTEARAQLSASLPSGALEQANLSVQRDIAQARRRVGVILCRKGDRAGCASELRQASDAMTAVAERDPTFVGNRLLQVATLNDYAAAARSAADFRAALRLLAECVPASPSRTELIRERARAEAGAGEPEKSASDWAEFGRRSPRFTRPPEI